MTYNVQEQFHMKGVFSIRVTPLGSNLCLLEEVGVKGLWDCREFEWYAKESEGQSGGLIKM